MWQRTAIGRTFRKNGNCWHKRLPSTHQCTILFTSGSVMLSTVGCTHDFSVQKCVVDQAHWFYMHILWCCCGLTWMCAIEVPDKYTMCCEGGNVSSTLFCTHVDLLSGSLFSAVRGGKYLLFLNRLRNDNEGTVIHTYCELCTLIQ